MPNKFLNDTGLGILWNKIRLLLNITANEVKEDTKKYVNDSVSNISIPQSDWEEETTTDNDYILNKPSIKAGEGENSVLIGDLNQTSTAEIYDIAISGNANATEYTYTTEATIATPSKTNYILFYSNKFYPLKDMTDGVLTLFSSIGNTAINNADAKLYYKYKIASGTDSIAEGQGTIASGQCSHAEGAGSKAIGSYSHAEGTNTVSNGTASHSEGFNTEALKSYSHAEGFVTTANGLGTHSEGYGTIASGNYQHVQGKYNIEDTNGTYAHIVGNGSSTTRSNAHTLDWSGNGWYAGKLTVGTAPTANMDVATKQYVDDNTNSLFIVTITSTTTDGTTTYSADKTFSEILAYINSSHNVVCKYYDNIYQLGQFTFSSIVFSNAGIYMDEGFNVVEGKQIYIYDDDTIFVTDTANTCIPMSSSTIPLMDGVAYIGDNQFSYACADHIHPTDTTRAAVTDVLTKTNTTSYTPTANYHPATKRYVDDAIPTVPTKVSDLTNDSNYLSGQKSTSDTGSGYLISRNVSSLSTGINKSIYIGTSDNGLSQHLQIGFHNSSDGIKGKLKLSNATSSQYTTITPNATSDITITLPSSTGTLVLTSDVLTKTNVTSYTPTADYHPATKKYVDDATAGIISNLSGLTDTTISSPTDGQLLKYNATTSKWENATLSLAIDNGVIQLKEGNTVISSITLPIYNGGVSS